MDVKFELFRKLMVRLKIKKNDLLRLGAGLKYLNWGLKNQILCNF